MIHEPLRIFFNNLRLIFNKVKIDFPSVSDSNFSKTVVKAVNDTIRENEAFSRSICFWINFSTTYNCYKATKMDSANVDNKKRPKYK